MVFFSTCVQCFFGQLIDSVASVKKKEDRAWRIRPNIRHDPGLLQASKKKSDVGMVPDRTRARSVVHSARTHFFSAVRQYVYFLFFSGDQVSESFREVGLVRHGQIND